MKLIPKRRLDDQLWLKTKYVELKYQKNFYGNLFFSFLIFIAIFFFLPLPNILLELLPFWQLGVLFIFTMITVAWYIFSIKFYDFCKNYLRHAYEKNLIKEPIADKEVVLFSNSQITLYILLALIIPVTLISILNIPVNYTALYIILGIVAFMLFVIFFFNIEDFYDRRDILDNQEMLVETLLLSAEYTLNNIAEAEEDLFKKDSDITKNVKTKKRRKK
jgi:hypothetical protein